MITHEQYFGNLQTAPVDNGIQYWEKGKGQTLLFLHGALSNGYTWRKILPALSESFHCIALHLPLGGHHISLSNHADLTPSGIADLICRFLKTKEIGQVVIVANDTGGAYAQVFASLYPEMTDSLVLSNCEVTDYFPPPQFVYLRYAVRIPGFTWLMGKLFGINSLLTLPGIMGNLSFSLKKRDIAEGYVLDFVSDKGVRNDFAKACRHWHPAHTLKAAELLKDFRAPVLILWGEQDKQLFPEHQMRKLLEVFPHAQWKSVSHAKTYIQEDAPAQTAAVILEFLRK